MRLSIILPTLNEAGNLGAALAALRAQGPCEIIVADGGSQDATLAEAGAADLIVQCPRGRARQMNAGAARATGDVLVFLHADCLLEKHALRAVRSCFGDARVAAACFTMRTRANGLGFRCIDWCATARVKLTGVIYGDQGLVVRRGDFHSMGGFPPVAFMEDVFFSRLLGKLGRVQVLPPRIWVSPRRWLRHGLIRQTLRNWTLTALALGGIPPDRLARWYPPHRGES